MGRGIRVLQESRAGGWLESFLYGTNNVILFAYRLMKLMIYYDVYSLSVLIGSQFLLMSTLICRHNSLAQSLGTKHVDLIHYMTDLTQAPCLGSMGSS